MLIFCFIILDICFKNENFDLGKSHRKPKMLPNYNKIK